MTESIEIIREELDRLCHAVLTERQAQYVREWITPRARRFYILPKINKDKA